MKIAIGSDHGGYEIKNAVIEYLEKVNIEYLEFGSIDGSVCDYPDVALDVSKEVILGNCKYGILICGTGIGISISANKIHGIRAALCNDLYSARMARQHNDSNVLCMGGRIIDEKMAIEIVKTFINEPFSGENRHINRINKIISLEKCENHKV